MIVLVTGVSGSGKTTVGQAAARSLGWCFVDADDLHTAEAKARMASGQPLDDRDRQPWLERLAAVVHGAAAAGRPMVLACSALKAAYRDRLIDAAGAAPVLLVFLDVDPFTADRRLHGRTGHFAGPSLVASQFAALEPPADALVLDATAPVATLAEAIGAATREAPGATASRAPSH